MHQSGKWWESSGYPTSVRPDLCLKVLYDGAGSLDMPKSSHKVPSLPSVWLIPTVPPIRRQAGGRSRLQSHGVKKKIKNKVK